jgi:hypothetical protein
MQRRLEIGLTAAVVAIAVLGLALLPLESAAFTRALAKRYSQASGAGLARAEALELAESVRAFVVLGKGDLAVQVEPSFTADEVSHLRDVHRVIARSRWVTMGAVGLAGMWVIAWALNRSTRRSAADALVAAGWAVGGATIAVLVVGLLSFDALFSAFHGLFFPAGTWTFPSDALLIRLFPEAFWVTAGASWAALVVVLAAACVAGGVAMRRSAA